MADPDTREEQALHEMAQTQISRGTGWLLVASFLLLLAGVPLWQTVHARDGAAAGADPRMLLPNAERFLPTAAELRSFEDDLEDASFLRAALLSPVQELLCRLGAGNESAYPGHAGWLYFRRDVDHVTGPGFLDPEALERRRREGDESSAPPEPDPLVGLVDLSRQLAERGIELVVVPTPAKPTVHPEFLTSEVVPDRLGFDNPSMEEFERRLAAAGIRTISLAPMFAAAAVREPQYLATDTHWTPGAMGLAAVRIADEVRPLLYEGADATATGDTGPSYRRQQRVVSNLGDITRMLQLDRPEELFPAEDAVIQQVEEVTNGQPQRAARVLLLGDSFANIYSLGRMGWGRDAGLVEQLQVELQEPVDALRINDNGSFATRQALRRELSQGNDLLAGKRVVVYQFAARELSQGDWRPIELPRAATAAAGEPASGTARVTGTLQAIAAVPRPGSVPYRDAVTSLHLTDLVGNLAAEEIVVFRWGMLDDVWTSAARLQPGARVTFDLVPWSAVSEQYGSFNRAELNDEALWSLPTYWAPLEEAEGAPVVEPGEGPAPSVAPPELAATGTWTERLTSLGEREVHAGIDGWLFFGPELRHLGAGPFWGAAAAETSRASAPDLRDPLPAILDFHTQLEGAGIELLVVPVPAKAAVYPEALGLDDLPTGGDGPGRADREFLDLLTEQGVHVADLFELFARDMEAQDGGAPLYCRQDTHWSPRATELVAEHLVSQIGAERFADVARHDYERTRRTIEIEGDLWRRLERPDLARESIELNVVLEDGASPRPWRDSPVLLLGDSHTLVFHAGGDLLAKGAGLPEQLAFHLGFPVDLVGVRGSGSTAARIALFRRRDELAGKRVVLWVFSSREFTQSTDGWREVPVIR